MKEIFMELGFTQRESAVYLALLEIGSSTVGPIASKTKIAYTKIYETLEKLIQKGLVTFVYVGKIKHFQAANPKELLWRLSERERKLKEVLAELELKQKFAKEVQSASVYEGFSAVKTMHNLLLDSLQRGDFYWVFAFKEEYLSAYDVILFLRTIHLRLADKRIEDKLIGHVSMKKNISETYKGISHIQIRFTELSLPQGLIITKERIINCIWGEKPTAIEVRSHRIAQQYKEFFHGIWKLYSS